LPRFTRKEEAKAMRIEKGWKDSFAESRFWNHNLAEKILGLCTQNVLPSHGFSLQKELEALLNSVA